MKHLLILGVLLSSTSVFASTLVNIKTLTNAKLEKATNDLIALEMVVSHSSAKKVVVLKGNGKTPQELREKTVAQAIHTLCPFFDDGVSIGLNEKNDKGSVSATDDLIYDANTVETGDANYNAILTAIKSANNESSVEVYSGSTSGNNTSGSVLGFYDVKNNEVSVFASTNCGSDD